MAVKTMREIMEERNRANNAIKPTDAIQITNDIREANGSDVIFKPKPEQIVKTPESHWNPLNFIQTKPLEHGYVECVYKSGKTIQEIFDIEYRNGKRPIMLRGPAGCGKSVHPYEFARRNRIPYIRISFDIGVTRAELYGQYTPCSGGFSWSPGIIPRIAVHPFLLVADELNMAQANVLAAFHAPLDFERTLIIPEHDHEVVKLHDDFWFIATINPTGYAGTHELNQGFQDRFQLTLDLESNPQVEKQLIRDKRILKIGQWIRNFVNEKGSITDAPISTRQLLMFERNLGLYGAEIALDSLKNRLDVITDESIDMLAEIQKIINDPNIEKD
jgi:hypothetical protein